jgi:intein/homing endonuclease
VINPASGAGTNYQVRIVAHYGSGVDSGPDVYLNGKCRTDFGDIRFTRSDGCYSDDTEILTENGWKLFKDLKPNEKVATLNPVTGELEYQVPTNYIRYYYRGKMFHQKGKRIDLLVTPNHRMYVRRWRNWDKFRDEVSGFELIEVTKLPKQVEYKRDAKWRGASPKYFILPSVKRHPYGNPEPKKIEMIKWLRFFGIWLAEGFVYKSKDNRHFMVYICQKTKENLPIIEKWIKEAGFKTSYQKDRFVICSKQLYCYLEQFGHAESKFIPKEIKALSPNLLRVLIESMCLGDGSPTTRKGGRIYWRYGTKSKQLADDLQEIAFKAGFVATIHYSEKEQLYTVTISDWGKTIRVNKGVDNREWIDYDGYVYCVEVPNHVVYVRRNGKAIWSGNSTLLDYWMEEKVDSDYAIFWVKVADDLSTNPVTIYVYYGNLSATTTSNPDATLIKYCGFEAGTLSPFNNIYPNDIFSVSSTVKKWGNYGAQANDPSSTYGGGRYSSANTFWALNKVAIEFWMRTDATSTSGGECSVYFTKGGYVRATLNIRDNGVFRYGGATSVTFGSASKGVWYKFVIELDYDNLKFNFRIYDASRNLLYSYADIEMSSVSVDYADVMMYSSVALVGLSYWDEFFSRKWVSPEPSHGSWGSEETPAVAYTITLTESLGLMDSAVKASSVVRRELLGLSDVYSRTWTAHRTYTEPLGLSDVVVKNVSAAKAESLGLSDLYARVWSIYRIFSESLGLEDFYTRCWTAYRVFAEPLGLSDMVSSVKLYARTLTELLGLSDVAVKAPSVVRAESLGLLDYYSRLWSVHRTYGETLGLADKVQKASSTVKSELLGLSDAVQKSPSILKCELLGLLDIYSRTWTAYRAFTEPLGLMDTVGKETSRTLAEALGLSDTFTRTWTIQRALGESLGLKDALQKTPSTLKTEMLGLLDSYSRTWLAFRTYTESLGLSDKVVKTAVVPLAETLGLLDKLAKSYFTTKTEKIGLADFTVKGISVARTERLGLSDALRKAPGKAFYEALGLKDVYSRVFTVHRTFTEPLGLKDTVSKGLALHALVEVLGLYDRVVYAPNVTVLAKLIRKYMQLVNLGGDWNE